MTAPDRSTAVSEPTPRRAFWQGDGRWLIYLLVLMGGMALVVALPSPYAAVALAGVLVVALLLLTLDAEFAPRWLWDQARGRGTRALAGGAVLGVLVATLLLRPAAGRDWLMPGAALLLVSGVLLWTAIRRAPDRSTVVEPGDTPLEPARANGWLTLLGVVCLALVGEINAGLTGLLPSVSTHMQFVLLAVGIILLTYGMSGAVPLRVWRRWRLAHGLLLLILLVALLARVVALDSAIRTLVDETHPIDGIQAIQWNDDQPLTRAASSYLPATVLYSYVQSWAINLVGANFVGLRLTGALVGTLNVLALYLLASALFNRRIALIAALLLATFPPHIHFSRVAHSHVADALFGTFAVAFFVRGLRSNRRLDWALSGAALGLTQYFYEGGRLLFPPLVAAWLVALVLLLRGHLRAQWRGLAVLGVVAVLVAAPVYGSIVASDASPTDRFDDAGTGLSYWRDLVADGITADERADLFVRLTLPLRVFVNQRELAVYYGGNQALVLDYMQPFFLLGVLWSVWHWRSPALVLILWLLATAAGNMIIRDPAQYPRYIVAFPAIALVMAVGWHETLTLLVRRPRWRLALLATTVIGFSAAQVHYYFGPHLAYYNVQLRASKQHPDGVDAILRALDLPPNTQTYLISDPVVDINPPRSLYGFFAADERAELPPRELSPSDVTHDWLADLPRDRHYAFFVEPDDTVTINLLSAVFDLEGPQESPYNVPRGEAFVLYFAPISPASDLQG